MVAPRNLSSASYTPGQVPTDPKDFPRFMREELDKISATVALLAAGQLDMQTTAPAKPRNGNIRYADAAVLGASKGVYLHNGTVWTLIQAIP